VAETHVLVREAEFLAPEKDGNPSGAISRKGDARFQPIHRLLGNTMLPGGGSEYQGAIAYRFSHGRKDAGVVQDMRPTDGRYSFAKRDIVGIDQAQIRKSKIRDGARCGPDVERVAGGDQDYC
jgi:hypothetical protein